MMRVHSPRARDERAPAPAPATSFADAVLKAPEPPRERFKWTAQRTVLYVVAFGMATWLTAFINHHSQTVRTCYDRARTHSLATSHLKHAPG